MFRYVVAVGDPSNVSDTKSIERVRGSLEGSSIPWRSAIDDPGLYASYIDGESGVNRPILLHDHRGAIFGKVYPSPGGSDESAPKPLRSVSRSHSEDIVQSVGRSLISRFWGYYVAVLHYPEKTSTWVIRSPVSPLACFHMQCGTFNLFFSQLQDCVQLNLATLSVNWDSITAQVVGADYLTHETAINEIAALECGEGVECTRCGCTKHLYWDPHRFLNDRSLNNFPEATRAMRNAVDHSVNALSSDHNSILVSLSGGLDSSIVLSALARSSHKPLLTAVSYHSRGCGDERLYARRMAQSVDCRMVEYARNDRLDLRCFYDCNLTVRPVLNFSAPDVEARNAGLARQLGATAIFDGELGDNVFGRNPTPGVLLDCIRRNGLGHHFLSVAVDYAMITRQSFWRTLAVTIQEGTSSARHGDFSALRKLQDQYGLEGARSLLLASTDAEKQYAGMAERFLHPWLKRAREIAPDSHKLLFGLVAVTSTSYHSPFGHVDDPQLVSPLVSQPLAEIALRIPGYLHCKSAQDRAVARAAFRDALPPEILNRGFGKGGPTTWAKDVVENNSKFLRDFLLDGILVQRGLLDRQKLETALSHRIAKSTAVVGDIFAKLYIEAWVRNFARLETSRD